MEQQKPTHQGVETELSRDLGLTTALAIGVGTMIAAGIFTLSGLAIRNVGSAAIVSFLLAAVVASFTALTYCEFVSIYPRTGEGYLYARKTYPGPLAYFVGWALVLGYTSSCAFYIASLSSYFNEFIWHSPVEALSGIVFLIILTLLNIKGTEESGRFQIIVTAAKVALLIWFVAGGLQFVNVEEVMNKFSDDIVQIGTTAAMVFITFFGFSAIAASAGEVKDPVKNIPRAIFISMGVVTLLYTAVVVVVLFAGLTEYNEASMGAAAQKFLGSIGGYVIIGGAIFSMVSASNASIMAGSRVILSMSQLGHLPREIGLINARTRTPIVSVFLVGGTILVFTLILPLEDLSYFANTVLLLALVLVNFALIVHRRKYPNIKRPFKAPLVPLIPILGIMANGYLLYQIFSHPIPFFMAIGTLLLGVVGFFTWKGSQPVETVIPGPASHVAHSHGRSRFDREKFRILVPIANPRTVYSLVRIAAAIARERDGELLLLRVVKLPSQIPLTSYEDSMLEKEQVVLEEARRFAEEEGVPAHAIIRIGYNIARAVLETSREHHCNLTVLGWKGRTSSQKRILGNITDTIITHAQTDIIMVKLVGNEPIEKILLPTAGGEHAQCAEQYAHSIVHAMDGRLTTCQVVSTKAGKEEVQQSRNNLVRSLKRLRARNRISLEDQLIVNDDVVRGIIEAADDYDAVMIGAAGQSIYPQILFGNIPEEIAKKINKTVIVVKHYHPMKALLGKVMSE